MIAAATLWLASALAQEPVVTWQRVLPARPLAVGEAVELVLEVSHGAELDARLDAAALDASWLLLEASPPRRVDGPDGARTSFELTVAPLATALAIDVEGRAVASEPLVLDGLAVRLLDLAAADDDDERSPLVAPPLEAAVADPIPAGADAPPLPRGLDALDLPPLPTAPWYARPWTWALALAALAVLALVAWRRKRARRIADARVPAPRERAEAAIAALAGPDASARRAALFELVASLRAAVDVELGAARAALVEEEWLALVAADPRATPIADRLVALSRATFDARWRGEEPSAYALDGVAAAARAVLVALGTLGAARAEQEGRAA